MPLPISNQESTEPLVKHTVADCLRKEIASGGLRPGARIVEGTWARKFGVAQGSIREAINLLAQDGFVTKEAGRSARVVKLSEENVLQMFELRSALEGLAARILSQRTPDLGPVDEALARMRQALKDDQPEDMLDADLKFHLELCRLSGNRYLLEHARKILLPLFAFARIRVLSSGQDASAWHQDLESHQRMVDLIKEGQADVAEHYARHAISRFGQNAYDNWEKKPVPTLVTRSRRRAGAPGKNDVSTVQ
jgi:DNA-binding GntR family transcriptional regulator